MPLKSTSKKANRAGQTGKSPSSQAGEFVREEIENIRGGKHGARNTKQAIAIGLSKARRAGIKLPPPKPGTTSAETRRKAQRDLQMAGSNQKTNAKRSRATTKALKREGRAAASTESLSRHAHSAARKRSPSAKKAARSRSVKR
jgi:hypothetical protein